MKDAVTVATETLDRDAGLLNAANLNVNEMELKVENMRKCIRSIHETLASVRQRLVCHESDKEETEKLVELAKARLERVKNAVADFKAKREGEEERRLSIVLKHFVQSTQFQRQETDAKHEEKRMGIKKEEEALVTRIDAKRVEIQSQHEARGVLQMRIDELTRKLTQGRRQCSELNAVLNTNRRTKAGLLQQLHAARSKRAEQEKEMSIRRQELDSTKQELAEREAFVCSMLAAANVEKSKLSGLRHKLSGVERERQHLETLLTSDAQNNNYDTPPGAAMPSLRRQSHGVIQDYPEPQWSTRREVPNQPLTTAYDYLPAGSTARGQQTDVGPRRQSGNGGIAVQSQGQELRRTQPSSSAVNISRRQQTPVPSRQASNADKAAKSSSKIGKLRQLYNKEADNARSRKRSKTSTTPSVGSTDLFGGRRH